MAPSIMGRPTRSLAGADRGIGFEIRKSHRLVDAVELPNSHRIEHEHADALANRFARPVKALSTCTFRPASVAAIPAAAMSSTTSPGTPPLSAG